MMYLSSNAVVDIVSMQRDDDNVTTIPPVKAGHRYDISRITRSSIHVKKRSLKDVYLKLRFVNRRDVGNPFALIPNHCVTSAFSIKKGNTTEEYINRRKF